MTSNAGVALAAVMTEGGAEVVIGAEAPASAYPTLDQIQAGDDALVAVREFFSVFCEDADFALSASKEALIRKGVQVQLLDEPIEQVSRDLGDSGTERCALVTSFSDGGSSSDSEGCVAVYEISTGGWLLIEYQVPEYTDDESDIHLNGVTLFPAAARDALCAEVSSAAVDACLHLTTRAGYIAKYANDSGLVADDFMVTLSQRMVEKLREAA